MVTVIFFFNNNYNLYVYEYVVEIKINALGKRVSGHRRQLTMKSESVILHRTSC